jgi:uncharacterized damage-inducible protein DinB
MFSYDDWANCETLASLERVTAPPRALEIMAHIVGCQWLWVGRLEHTAQPAEVWPSLTLAECRVQLSSLDSAWTALLGDRVPHRLDESVRYTNSQGEIWTSSVQDVLTHIPIHSAYHRGQIATLLGRAGYTPAYTDFIHCVRQGLITDHVANGVSLTALQPTYRQTEG